MIAVYFVYGLAFFCLGLAVVLEARKASELPLSRQLPWLAAFGLVHAVVEWSDMFLLTGPADPFRDVLLLARTVLLPLSAILLIRFGAGMIGETGPLPQWLWFLPLALTLPAALLVAHALVTATVDPYVAIDVWSRYLLYFSGSVLAGVGFLRQRQALTNVGLNEAGNLLLAAAVLSFFNALVAGLIVPPSPYGLAPWLNYDTVLAVTAVPVQFWRMLAATALTISLVRALDLFEAKRRQQLERAESERRRAVETLRESEERFRTVFEMAPVGMNIASPDGRATEANLALQQMLGYTEQEFRALAYADYTHPDDVAISRQLVREVAEGKRKNFRLEKRYLRKDGSLVWGHTAVSAVRDLTGQLRYLIAMVEDITQRKHAEEALAVEREHVQTARLQAASTARDTAEKWFETLVDISRRISRMHNVDEVLLHIVLQAQDLLKSDVASLALMDDSGSQLLLDYQAVGPDVHVLDPPRAVDSPPLMDMLASGASYRFPEDTGHFDTSHAIWQCATTGQAVEAAAVVPLRFDGRLIGGIWVARFDARSYTTTDVIGLESLADQSVVAVQHALMAARLQSLAVLEERSRIAREMHDGLAQVLGYLSLQVQTLAALVARGDNDKALAELKQTRANIKAAQADVRENILSLRTTLVDGTDPVSALREYVTEFGLQSGQKTELVVEVDDVLALSPLAEVQMVRIVQESLANVRKHAQAEHVEVRLSKHNGCLSIIISDDGIGFKPLNDRHRFGLQTMRERAEMAGGSLGVRSVPGKGTAVELLLPLQTP